MLTPDSPDKKHSLFPKKEVQTEDDNSWQISYLDIFTILLGFMFVLLSLSDLNQISFTSISNLFQSSALESRFITTPIDDIKKELEALLQDEIENGELEIVRDLNDVRIRFSSDDLYQSGSATLQLSALDLLDRVLAAIKAVPYNNFHIDVEGHTDSTPISSQAYPSNWELSTARASKIVKYFTHMGIKKQRLKASGYADSQPRVANEDSLGNPIPGNKDKNRRIVLRLYYTSVDTQTTEAASDSAIATQMPEKTPDLNCRYSVQAGLFSSFPNGFNAVRNLETSTNLDFDLTYNGQRFSVRTKPVFAIAEAIQKYNTLSSQVAETSLALIHQCYENEQKAPAPLEYQIQFGAFQSRENAQAYMSRLSEMHQISTHLEDNGSPFYKIVSDPYEENESAMAKLASFEEKELSNEIFIDYIPASYVSYAFKGQLQLGNFGNQEQATDFAEQIRSVTGIEIKIRQFEGERFYVLTPKLVNREEALALQDRIQKQMPNLSPLLYLLEYVPQKQTASSNTAR